MTISAPAPPATSPAGWLNNQPYLLLSLASLFWAGNIVLARHVGHHVPPLTLTTIRSHDQYNTTLYGLNDRYRGITGRRDVVFVNANDLARRGLEHGDVVDVIALMGAYHTTSMLFAVERYPLPPGEKEEIARPM